MTEQGAQALRDFPESDDPQINEERALLRVGFLRGAEWQASRQPEAAPFDTDPGIAEDEPDLPNGHAPVERLTPFVARRVRASQPVQVEVTDGRLFCEVHGHTCPAGHYRCRKVEVTEHAPVITLCGSTKFKDAINAENMRLTMEGNVVISLGLFGHTDLPDYNWDTDATELKTMLDRLHFQKIRMADRVHVVNPGGYYGESTAREIEYARSLGKPVTFMTALGGGDHAAESPAPGTLAYAQARTEADGSLDGDEDGYDGPVALVGEEDDRG